MEFKKAIKFNEIVYWNQAAYGSAFHLRKSLLKTLFVMICLVTPATNWMIPLISRIVKNDIIIRY